MRCLVIVFLALSFCIGHSFVFANESIRDQLPTDLGDELPTVLITILVRNKAHILPYFLSYLERLEYPKRRIALWIRSDHNSDDSLKLLELWLNHTSALYHSVDYVSDNTTQRHRNESSSFDWPQARFEHLIKLKEQALLYADEIWADYIFFLDADVMLADNRTLKTLVDLNIPIVAPMLLSEGLYSNFWCGMTTDYYYQRTDEYKEIYNVNKEGVFKVPMIHSAVLIKMNYRGSRYLTFDRERLIEQQKNDLEYSTASGDQCRLYDGPLDDIIVFAISANCSQIPLFISNELPYGYILRPLENIEDRSQDLQLLVNIKVNMIHDLGFIPEINSYFIPFTSPPAKHKLTLDHIYMINLKRRPERREKMEKLLAELGLDYEYYEAIDGKDLNESKLSNMGIKFLPGYADPYHNRNMTMGEIGCFLSHYNIWKKMIELQQKEVLILEDDIRFEPYFKEQAENVLQQARNVVDYDLIYFGRKRLKDEKEPWVANTENLVHVGYSYWTLGYVISLEGAKKLLAAKPLEKLLPVDEFLPIMFNRHPNTTWSSAFTDKNLVAFSSAPLLLYPTHYTGENGYISDTEDSKIITESQENSDRSKQYKSDREEMFSIEESNIIGSRKDLDHNTFVEESLNSKIKLDMANDLNLAKREDL